MTDQTDAKATAYGCLATIVLFVAVGVGANFLFRTDPEEDFARAVKTTAYYVPESETGVRQLTESWVARLDRAGIEVDRAEFARAIGAAAVNYRGRVTARKAADHLGNDLLDRRDLWTAGARLQGAAELGELR